MIANRKTKRLDVFYEKVKTDFKFHTFKTLEELENHITENKNNYSIKAINILDFSGI